MMSIYRYFVKRNVYYFSDTVCYETKFLLFPTIVGSLYKGGIGFKWMQWATIYWLWNVSYGWRKIRFVNNEDNV